MTEPQKPERKQPETLSNNAKDKSSDLIKDLLKKKENVKAKGWEWKVFSVLVGSALSLRLAVPLLGKTKDIERFKTDTFDILDKLILTNAMLDKDIQGEVSKPKEGFREWFADYYLHNSLYRLSMLTTHVSNGEWVNEIKKITENIKPHSVLSYEKFHELLRGNQKDCWDQLYEYSSTLSKYRFNNPEGSKSPDKKSPPNLKEETERHKWVVSSRHKNQKLLCKLYKKKEYKDNMNGDEWEIFSALVGSTFSLWRAAPHCDYQRDEHKFKINAFDLLDILKGREKIEFTQEIENQEWMVGYYLRNSYSRLALLNEDNKFKKITGKIEAVDSKILEYSDFNKSLKTTPQACWSALHKYSKELFEATFV